MKLIACLLLMSLSSNSFSQEKDSLYKYFYGSGTNSGITYIDSTREVLPSLPEKDTVPVTMLYTYEETRWENLNDHLVLWMKGYSVRKRHNLNDDSRNGNWCVNCEDYMLHSYYLDVDKKELSKTITVWMSK